MFYKLASISLTSTQKNNTSTEIYISQPDANKEALAGKLFILAEIGSDRAGALKIINFLINNLNHNYYNNEKIILRERISTLKVEHIFEASLAKTNNELHEFVQKEKIKLKPNILNITIGVIYEDKIHFSSIGKNKALLIYKKRDDNEKKNTAPKEYYKIIDVIEAQKENSGPKLNFNKLFSNVISGNIPKGGYFLFSNETLPEYLSNKQLLDIITKLPPAGAAEQIKNILGNVNAYVSFVGIIIKNTVGIKNTIEQETAPEIKNNTQQSVSKLNQTEENTEKYLTPSGLIDFKKWFNSPFQFFSNIKLFSKTSKNSLSIKDKIFFKKKPPIIPLKKILITILSLFVGIWKIIRYIFSILTNKEKLYDFIKKIKNFFSWLKDKILNIGNIWKNLNIKNKSLIIIFSLLVILLTSSLTVTHIGNKQQEIEQKLAQNYEAIDLKQNQIDANLLYNNENGAKEALKEVEILLAAIPKETDDEKRKYEELNKKHLEQLEKIQHVVKINDPVEIANFNNLNSQAKADNIILIENKLYAGDSTQDTIYKTDIKDGLVTAITDMGGNIENILFPVKDNNNNIYYLNNGKLLALDTKNENISNVNININGDNSNIAAMASYNNRVYLLDKKNNQVYRHSRSGNDFTLRDPWILDNVDFSDAASLDIDGYVYVLKNNGEVMKFLRGELQDFNLDEISPEFANPTKILVSPDLEFIYILEPVNSRLAIFNKAGDFLIQYKSDKFDNLKDFAVDEINKKIYFLNNNSIYAIEGSHF